MSTDLETLSRAIVDAAVLSDISKDSRLDPLPNVEFRSTPSGGGILVDLDSGACFQVNRTGADVWTLAQERKVLGDMVEYLALKCNVPNEVAEKDLVAIFEDFVAAKLATIRVPGVGR